MINAKYSLSVSELHLRDSLDESISIEKKLDSSKNKTAIVKRKLVSLKNLEFLTRLLQSIVCSLFLIPLQMMTLKMIIQIQRYLLVIRRVRTIKVYIYIWINRFLSPRIMLCNYEEKKIYHLKIYN